MEAFHFGVSDDADVPVRGPDAEEVEDFFEVSAEKGEVCRGGERRLKGYLHIDVFLRGRSAGALRCNAAKR